MKQLSRSIPKIGLTFGRWTVLELGEPIYYEGRVRDHKYLCKCKCGTERFVSGSSLLQGRTKSCGCLRKEKRSGACLGKHHMSYSTLYSKYTSMKDRCFNEKNKFFSQYGGRGIKVCDEWLGENGFENFMKWADESNYKDNLSLERIDVNGNYEPLNCSWIPLGEQQWNKKNTLYKDGIPVAKFAREVGIVSPHIARHRIYMGWSLQDAVYTPVLKKGERLETAKETYI